jgi:hypothetical protein
MDTAIKENVLTVTRLGQSAAESTDFFRTALGLHYLAALMTNEAIDFKQVDREYNRFIYHTIGRGHTITSVLQFMSGAKVVAVLESKRFLPAFAAHCTTVPAGTVPFLLSLNLSVAKKISGIDIGGPVLDWIERQKPPEPGGPVPRDVL